MRLRIRKCIDIYRDNQYMFFVLVTDNVELKFKAGNEIDFIVDLLDGNYENDEIFELLHKSFPEITYEMFTSIINKMIDNKIVEENLDNEYSSEYFDKFSRQLAFFEKYATLTNNKYVMQKKLMNSRVAVFGLGGTGSWIIQGLVLAGVENFRLFDFDYVEISNLNRQVMYKYDDIGKLKTEAMKEHIIEISPNSKVETFEITLTKDTDLENAVKNCDLVINCTDYPSIFQTSMWVCEACMKLNIPHIVAGGYKGDIAMIGPTIIPNKTACWKCYELATKDKKPNEGKLIKAKTSTLSNIGVIPAITANIQIWDAIRILTGQEPLNVNKKGLLNFEKMSFKWFEFDKNSACPLCGEMRK